MTATDKPVTTLHTAVPEGNHAGPGHSQQAEGERC
ncbi:hypothetical protein SAMN05428945_4587 [Streptomyces sp. 2224.1]|nr:hypothetical protein SAMN05428945_4587 [Streptomyces sp. 2224.1]SEF12035.1 hypothetical protein SAMN05428954_6524 [Streptomyces sp. 2112.3]